MPHCMFRKELEYNNYYGTFTFVYLQLIRNLLVLTGFSNFVFAKLLHAVNNIIAKIGFIRYEWEFYKIYSWQPNHTTTEAHIP